MASAFRKGCVCGAVPVGAEPGQAEGVFPTWGCIQALDLPEPRVPRL